MKEQQKSHKIILLFTLYLMTLGCDFIAIGTTVNAPSSHIKMLFTGFDLQKFVGRRTEKKISKLLGIGDQGTVTFHTQSDREGYCPGEKIAISCRLLINLNYQPKRLLI